MERISENLRSINIKDFEPTGNLINDVQQLSMMNGRNPLGMQKGMALVLGLRIKLGDPFTVHVLTEAVCKKVQKVKIEHIPEEYPIFLKNPFLIEAKPGKVLFDNIDTIGGFIDKDDFILIIWAENGTYFNRIKNPFNGLRFDQITYIPHETAFYPQPDQNKNVLPFLTVLALMMEAEKTPIIVDNGSKKAKRRNETKNNKTSLSDWIERRVYIDARYSVNRADNSKTVKDTIPFNPEGKEKTGVHIEGFLRYQAHGPGHSLRKWIYVDEFDTTRWRTSGNKRITVDAYFKNKEP